jgi:mxaD protein
MASRTAEISIDRPPDAVWAVVGDFGGLASWMPGVETCRTDGDTRVIGMLGIEVAERLVARDDAARTLIYAIADGPLPLESHEAAVTVHADGSGTRVTWEVTVVPDEHVDMFGDIYRQSLEALRAHCEAGAT